MLPPVPRLVTAFLAIGIAALIAAQTARYVVISRFPGFRDGTWFATVDDFRLVHLHVNYFEHGYLRRGLIGSLLHAIGAPDPVMAGWMLSLLAMIGFFGFVGWVVARTPPDRQIHMQIIALVMVLGPAGVAQIVADAGRVDHVFLVLAPLAALAGLRGRLFLSLALFVLMCMVHELALIALAPLLLVCNSLGASDRVVLRLGPAALPFSRRTAAAFGLAIMGVAVVTVAFGDSPQAVLALSTAEGQQPEYAAMIWGPGSPIHHISWQGLPSLLLLLYYLALVTLAVAHARSLDPGLWLLPASTVSCLILLLVGIDAGRWGVLSTWVVLTALLAAETAQRRAGGADGGHRRLFVVSGVLRALPVGPLGVIVPFEFVTRLVGYLTA